MLEGVSIDGLIDLGGHWRELDIDHDVADCIEDLDRIVQLEKAVLPIAQARDAKYRDRALLGR